ncbi:MAG: amidohydrolase family protein [Acidobacteria bacterium]|nr:amidohydrolase family protein [Acidobacteriota bacterium]
MTLFRPCLSLLATLSLLLLTTPAVAEGPDATGPYVIHAGTLIDGSGGEPMQDAVIIVEDGRITAVGQGLKEPRGATVIDLKNRTVLPGFIDAHVHLTGRHIGEGRDWENARVRDLPQEDAIRGVAHASPWTPASPLSVTWAPAISRISPCGT